MRIHDNRGRRREANNIINNNNTETEIASGKGMPKGATFDYRHRVCMAKVLNIDQIDSAGCWSVTLQHQTKYCIALHPYFVWSIVCIGNQNLFTWLQVAGRVNKDRGFRYVHS